VGLPNVPVANEDQLADEFIGFLRNLVKVFPSLSTRPVYLTGQTFQLGRCGAILTEQFPGGDYAAVYIVCLSLSYHLKIFGMLIGL
jgi:hypothetical protein